MIRPSTVAVALALAGVATSPACTKDRGEGARTQDEVARDPAPPAEQPPATKAPAPTLAGTWRLVAEEKAEGGPLTLGQQERELTIADDGTFEVRSFHETWKGTWERDGDALEMTHRDGNGNDVVATAKVEELAATRLVLVEQLPAILERPRGTPVRARNTYRRVRDGDFGPLLGDEVAVAAPAAGRYAAGYTYSQSKYPTMERLIARHIRGAAVLELGGDGVASLCAGVRTRRSSSVSRHASHDGQHHSDESEDARLLGARGTWKLDGDRARVSFTELQRGSCDVTEPTGGPLELTCVALEPNERLPVAALACQLAPWLGFDALAINPADSPRAGPYTLQAEPRSRMRYDPGTPWLLLGAAPGLAIEARDRRGRSPVVSFAADEVDFVERNYQPRTP